MFHTSGFALRKNDYREYDRIYTVYTSDFGKISLLARGARKIKSKLAPHLEGMNEVRLNFAKGKIFNHLSGANVASINKGLLNDEEKIFFISDCFYLLDRFIKPEEGDARIYDLIKEVFGAITGNFLSPLGNPRGELEGGFCPPPNLPQPLFTKEGGSPFQKGDELQKIRIYFFWRLADLLGYRPQLDECALCGNISPPPLFRGEGRVGCEAINTPSASGISPLRAGKMASVYYLTEPEASKEVERKKLKFNITDNIIICGECIGDGVFIQNNTLENLKKIFQSGLVEFLKIELDSQLTAITEKARQIKLSEL